jgi:hypothetical protein
MNDDVLCGAHVDIVKLLVMNSNDQYVYTFTGKMYFFYLHEIALRGRRSGHFKLCKGQQ